MDSPRQNTLPQPYYTDGFRTIYLGDCRNIIPLLPKVDLVLTDPPYGIDFGNSGGFVASHGWGPWRKNVEWDKQRPEKDIFDAMLNASYSQCIWGGNYFTDYLPPTMRWLVWDKGQREFSLADFEMAWTSQYKASRIFVYPRGAALQDGKQHPTQKPLSLMKWCLQFFPDIKTILDPFMGSETTLRAAADLGLSAIGIEIEERYCEIAAKRLSQTVLPFADTIIRNIIPVVHQEELFNGTPPNGENEGQNFAGQQRA